MKKLWKIKRDSEAVSPVIATILMVAITVVLAAVLLVLVLNIGDDTVTPAGNLEWDESSSTVTVTYLSQSVPQDDLEWNGAINTGSWNQTGNVISGYVYDVTDAVNGTATLVYVPTGVAIATVTITGQAS